MKKKKSEAGESCKTCIVSGPPVVLTKSERIELLQKRAQEMINFFKTVENLPSAGVKISPGQTILNVEKFISTQIATIEHGLKDPFNRIVVCAYQRLNNLKTYLENEQFGTTDMHPGTKRRVNKKRD